MPFVQARIHSVLSGEFLSGAPLRVLTDGVSGAENERVRVLGNHRAHGLVAVDEEDQTVSPLTKEMYCGEIFPETYRRCGQRTG
jgi:hypothetical protein